VRLRTHRIPFLAWNHDLNRKPDQAESQHPVPGTESVVNGVGPFLNRSKWDQTGPNRTNTSGPEVILRAGFDVKVDIWALGCIVRWSIVSSYLLCAKPNQQVFELLTGRWLFRPSGGVEHRRRPIAAELRNHDWVAGADWCRDYRGCRRGHFGML